MSVKSFKKYSWIITGIFGIIIFISGLTINDISFIPAKYQSIAVGIIGLCAMLANIIPTNYRVKIAELLAVENERNTDNEYVYIEDTGLRQAVQNYLDNQADDTVEIAGREFSVLNDAQKNEADK